MLLNNCAAPNAHCGSAAGRAALGDTARDRGGGGDALVEAVGGFCRGMPAPSWPCSPRSGGGDPSPGREGDKACAPPLHVSPELPQPPPAERPQRLRSLRRLVLPQAAACGAGAARERTRPTPVPVRPAPVPPIPGQRTWRGGRPAPPRCHVAAAPLRSAPLPPGAPAHLAAGRAAADPDEEGLAAAGLPLLLQPLLAVPRHPPLLAAAAAASSAFALPCGAGFI